MKRIFQIVAAALLCGAAIGSLVGVGNTDNRRTEELLNATPSVDRTMAVIMENGQPLAIAAHRPL